MSFRWKKQLLLAISVGAIGLAATAPAEAWGGPHRYYHGPYGYGSYRPALVAGVATGAVIGAVVGSSLARPVYAAPPVIYASPPVVYAPVPPSVAVYAPPVAYVP